MKKALTIIFVIAIIAAMMLPAAAAPFKEIIVGEGETVIEAVWFDGGFENYESDGSGNKDIREDEEVATYDYTINDDYEGGRETDTPSCIGWIGIDEWVQYTIQVQVAGTYQLSVWGASGSSGGDFVAYLNGTQIGSAFIEDDGGWHYYTLYPVGTFDMTVGTHVIRTEFPDGGINFESFVLTLIEAAPAPEPEPEAEELGAGGGDPADIPAPAAAAPEPAPAPQTSDCGIIFTILALVFSASVLVALKIRKNRA